MDQKAFIGFEYSPLFVDMVQGEIVNWLRGKSIEAVFPLSRGPGGDLLFQIFQMIESSNLALFDCTTLNPNVVFELGYAIGKKKPFFVLYGVSNKERKDLPSVLKCPWGIWYDSATDLRAQLNPVTARQYPLGDYDYRTNELFLKSLESRVEANRIAVLIDSKGDYQREIDEIARTWHEARLYLINIDHESSFSNLIEFVEKSAITITILGSKNNPAMDYDNAAKLLGHGTAMGLARSCLLFQGGEEDYSDTVGLSNHYLDTNQFRQKLEEWNKKITAQEIRKGTISRRIGIPNLGRTLTRERLNDFINLNLFSKIVYIRAPSGYGKSALMVDTLSQKAYPTIWYTFDVAIRDIAEFIVEVISKIQEYQPEIGANLLTVVASASRREIPEYNLVTYFCNELGRLRNRLVLVLDDVHLINEKESSKGLEVLFRTLPKNIGLAILSREELGFLSQNQLSESFAVLKKEELEFNKQEIEGYIQKSFGLSLSNQELDVLTEKSDGWIASITLLQSIVAQRGKDAIPEIIRRLKGTDVKIYDYFADIVYDNFDQTIRQFFLRTSVLNTLTAQSVSFVLKLEAEKSLKMLEELEGKNSFLFNFQNNPNVFRYHPLFQEFLNKKFETELGKGEVRKSKFELSQFYLDNEEYVEAINYGTEGQNYLATVKAVSKIGNFVLNEGFGKMVSEWMSQIPKEHYSTDYDLLVLKGRADEHVGRVREAEDSFKQAEMSLLGRAGKEKEANFVRFLKSGIKFIKDVNLEELKKELTEIGSDAKRYGDETTYFAVAQQLFSIRCQTLLKIGSRLKTYDLGDYERTISEIDAVLQELNDSSLRDKNLYRSQILIEKAKLAHFVGWFRASQMSKVKQLNDVLRMDIPLERRKKYLSKVFEAFDLEAQCFKEALEIAEKDEQLLVKANLLIERAETLSSRFNLMYLNFGFHHAEFVDAALVDLQTAARTYSQFGHHYGLAVAYNNAAQTFLLKNDKTNRDKHAQLALSLAQKHGFSVIERKAKDILALPTIEEVLIRSASEATKSLEEGMTEEERQQFLDEMLNAMGEFGKDERQKRAAIMRKELEDVEFQKQLQKTWCRYIDVFHTNNPLSKHPDTGIKMIRAYLAEERGAVELYDSKRDDYGKELTAKFVYCRLLGHHSDSLQDRINKLSDSFIGRFCHNCAQRELRI